MCVKCIWEYDVEIAHRWFSREKPFECDFSHCPPPFPPRQINANRDIWRTFKRISQIWHYSRNLCWMMLLCAHSLHTLYVWNTFTSYEKKLHRCIQSSPPKQYSFIAPGRCLIVSFQSNRNVKLKNLKKNATAKTEKVQLEREKNHA